MALPSSPDAPQPLRVIVGAVKDWVERLGPVWVEGQLIEVKRRSGAVTQYLTLRDKLAEVSVTLSTSAAVLDAAGPLAEGTMVAAWVKPTIWTKSGSLTFECRELRPTGEGRLLAAIEQRKRMLQAEGLFDPALKRRLPLLPRRIGLITGAGSAAERDVVENIARRWPAAVLDVRHTLVQGTQAVEEIVHALRALAATPGVDVIIIARGGGSLEDLLPFSDETLVRAVHACTTPVVSAIGHETDTPILDLVADLRASTPTDAAKRVVPDAREEDSRLSEARTRIRTAVLTRLANETRRLAELRTRPVLRDPSATLEIHLERVSTARSRLTRAIEQRLREEANFISQSASRVRAMSPRATLQRGYAILVDASGDTVSSVADTSAGAAIAARVADGRLHVTVHSIETQEGP